MEVMRHANRSGEGAVSKLELWLLGAGVLFLFVLGGYLFFGDQLRFFVGESPLRYAARGEDEVLTIGYAFGPEDFDWLKFDGVTRSHLVDVYEGLVRTNRDLQVEPALAITWGRLDEVTWEFRLRPSVVFHNGDELSARDVVYSVEQAMTHPRSQLQDLLATVQDVQMLENNKVRVRTRVADPLLLEKLATVFVVPEGFDNVLQPVGTGPYRFVERNASDTHLARFSEYWRGQPAFSYVALRVLEQRNERMQQLRSGELHLLTNAPPAALCSSDGECDYSDEPFVVRTLPSLEVNFVMFQLEHPLLQNKTVRKALAQVFDKQVFVDMALGFAQPANQFVSSGVFGFDPTIGSVDYDLVGAKEVIDTVIGGSFERPQVVFDYPEALRTVGSYVQNQFAEVGIDVILNPLADALLQEKIQQGESELYFVGWRSELGDAGDFLQTVAHSDGQFNGMGYANSQVDDLIEATQKEFDETLRLQQLQEVMRILVKDDVVGVPLFQTETLFAFDPGITFEPRVDGLVFASDIY